MKRMVLVLLLGSSLTVFSQSDKYGFDNLVGSWRNSSGAGLDVVDSNTIYIVNGGQRKLATASLSDYSRNPVSLNLTIKGSDKAITVKSLLLFVNDTMLQWQVFTTETKPVSYQSEKSDMLFLKKIKELDN